MAKEELKIDWESRLKALEDQNATLMAALEAKAANAGNFDVAALEQVLTRVTEAAAAPTNALVRKMKPENAEGRKIGPYEHPDGGEKYPKPDLPCEVFFGCKDSRTDTRAILRLHSNELTYFEVMALHELHQSLAPGQRRMTRDGKWRVFMTEHGDALHLMVPIKDPDDRQDLPGLLAIFNELKTGARTPNASDLAAQVALLEQKVAELSSHASA